MHALAGALLLALVHLFAGKLRFLDVIPRSRWLSFSSGISVSYVFLHLLPELSAAREPVRRTLGGPFHLVEHHIYLLVTIGLAAFFGLERMAERSRQRLRSEAGMDRAARSVFWLHTLSFAVYNALIGYILGEKAGDPVAYGLFLVAMALHFLVNDYGLRDHFRHLYHDRGRWVLAGSVVSGAAAGLAVEVPRPYLMILLALLAGGVTLNVLKEELPEQRESRFWAFALGIGAYALLLEAI